MLENFYTCYVANSYHDAEFGVDVPNILFLQPSTDYTIESIDGLTPPQVSISGTPLIGTDGQILSNNRIDTRTITITLHINNPIETNRIKLYEIFKLKKKIGIYFKNGTRDVHIVGYVETFEINLFSMKQVAQITIKCLDPYLQSNTHYVYLSQSRDEFEYPFAHSDEGEIISEYNVNNDATFEYNGDVETGVEIEMVNRGETEIVGPITIHTAETNKLLALSYNIRANEKIVINTNVGEKSILSHYNEKQYTKLETFTDGSTWLKITPGKNTFYFETKNGDRNIEMILKYTEKYWGV